MKLELSEAQYRALTKLVFLGNWIANSTKLKDEQNLEMEELEQLIYSYSYEFEMNDLIEFDEKFNEYFPTRKFEEQLENFIDDYDNFNFWQELSSRLARRDLINEIGPVSKLTDRHKEREFEIEETYENEFEKNGLKNLVLKEPDKRGKLK
ncbi:hypothetical protein M6D81_31850 [Paenibacillus sp. J5C_2022]|uniref:hypothetical protein n=1 Tax=Paenibacillus sp. J5C2022 TaxID=2977129 RepID=UPI0021CED336|nr:hypothetical protein [Paenibacillus sp. J5C2022]MCU6713290.1 hypothetical protein [Paenibacillus sp. J5C2022]